MLLDQEDNEYSASLSRFETMMKSDKVFFFDSEEFEEIIYHYIDMGKMQLAKKAIQIALNQHPTSPDLKLIQAEILIHDDKFELADKILNDLKRIDPNNDEVYIQKSNIFSKQGQHHLAIEELKIALEITEEKADIYHIIGMEYMFLDELESAKTYFILCLEDDIDDHSALYNVVYCFEFLDQFDACINYLDGFIDRNPYSEVAWHQKGRMAKYVKKYDLALSCFDYAALIDENFLGAVLEKAKTLQKLKRFEEAIEVYKSTFHSGEPEAYTYLRIGKCYKKLKNDKQTLKYFYKAAAEDPLLDKTWRALANYFFDKKDFQKSLNYIEKAIHIERHQAKNWEIFLENQLVLDSFPDIIYALNGLLNCEGLAVEDYLTYVDVLIENEKTALAATALECGINKFENHLQLNYRLVGLYIIQNKTKLAKDLLKLSMDLFPINIDLLYEIFPQLIGMKRAQNIINPYKI